MSDKNIIFLNGGDYFLTKNADDAFIVLEGALLIYAVQCLDGEYSKRNFVYKANQGEVIPAFCYKDMRYEQYCFLISAQDYASVKVIPNGSTKKLRTGFLTKIGMEDTPENAFNEAFADRLRVSRVTAKNFIIRSEQLRKQNADGADALIKEAHRKKSAEENKRSSYSRSIKEAFRLMRLSFFALSKNLLIVCFASLVASVAALAVFLHFLTTAFTKNESANIVLAFVMLVLLAASAIFLVYIKRAVSTKAQHMQRDILKQYFSLKNIYYRSEKTASIANELLNSYRIYESVLSSSIFFVGFSLFGVVCLVFAISHSPVIALVSIAVLIIYFTVYCCTLEKISQQKDVARTAASKANSLLYRFTSCVVKLRLAGAEERATLEYLRPVIDKTRSEENISRLRGTFDTISVLCPVLITALVSLISEFITAPQTFSDMAVCIVALTLGSAAITVAVNSFSKVSDKQRYVKRIEYVIDKYSEINADTSTDITVDTDISVDNITFAYEPGGEPILRNFSLNIRKGEYIAITGESGCGKSTLLKLLLGFETPNQGDIRYGDVSISQADIHALRRQIGVVLQDGRLISGTVAENITLTHPEATSDDIMAAVCAVGLDTDIATLPMGLNTVVSGNGEIFSDGQRQKILLARVLLSNPKLLLLDEATSDLDNNAQKVIVDALESLSATRIVIAHRLSTIRACDRIIVLRDGMIAEMGTYNELISRQGVFCGLVERQIVS